MSHRKRNSIKVDWSTFLSSRRKLWAPYLTWPFYKTIWQMVLHSHTNMLRLCGFCPGQPGWAGTRRNFHPITLIVVINHPYLLPPSTMIHDILPIQSTCFTVFFHSLCPIFFGVPLGMAPSTSYSIHFFTQSLSSFRSTCPYHCNLFWWSTKIISSNPSLPTKVIN